MIFRSDNAGEFMSHAFTSYLTKHGIKHQRSAPYAHQQNGKAERAIQTIEGRILAMLATVGASPSLWGEAALTVGYLWNVLPCRAIPGNVTPYELAKKKKPDLSNLRVWGVRCFARVPAELQTKLGAKS
jgi:hypothetical protein